MPANEAWKNLSEEPNDGKLEKGRNRPYRVIVSGTAYLIWKIRSSMRPEEREGNKRRRPRVVLHNRVRRLRSTDTR